MQGEARAYLDQSREHPMNFFTAERISTLSTEMLLDQLCDFSAQAARMKTAEAAARSKEIIALIKTEIASR